jgi:hypothetical protein
MWAATSKNMFPVMGRGPGRDAHKRDGIFFVLMPYFINRDRIFASSGVPPDGEKKTRAFKGIGVVKVASKISP